MYKKDSVRQLMESYRFTLTNRTMQRRPNYLAGSRHGDLYSYGTIDSYDYSSYIQEEVVPTVTIEIEESSLLQMADKIAEFDDLMRDPETAQLLMEARFINRLKGNR